MGLGSLSHVPVSYWWVRGTKGSSVTQKRFFLLILSTAINMNTLRVLRNPAVKKPSEMYSEFVSNILVQTNLFRSTQKNKHFCTSHRSNLGHFAICTHYLKKELTLEPTFPFNPPNIAFLLPLPMHDFFFQCVDFPQQAMCTFPKVYKEGTSESKMLNKQRRI